MTINAGEFLGGFFPEPHGAGERLLIWMLSADGVVKRSIWCGGVEEAARAASRLQGCNVYFAPNTFHDGLGPHEKGKAVDVVGVNALYADIDFAHAAKAKPYPPNLDAAKSILKAMPFMPSVVWNTGGGIQVAWFLKETEYLSDGDRPRVAGTVKGWVDLLNRHAKALGGWFLDPVGNLDRVLRLPGSMNVKAIYSIPKPVTVLEFDPARRFDLDDFAQYVDVAPYSDDDVPNPSNIVLNKHPKPHGEMFEVLFDFYPKFKGTWLKRRADLKDQSFSSYDMSLANIAVKSGFTDQEVADLILSFRLKHGTPQDIKKGYRLDYILRTIARARKDMEVKIYA